MSSDACDVARDRHARQLGAVVEGLTPDACDAAGDRYTRQPGAVVEATTYNAGDAAGDRHARQPGAGIEGGTPDGGDAAGDRVGTGHSSRILDEGGLGFVEQNPVKAGVVGIGGSHRDCRQLDARGEGGTSDAGDAIGDRHARQPGAGIEGFTFDGGDAAGDRVGTGHSSRILDEGGFGFVKQHSVHAAVVGIGGVYRDCCQPGAGIEGVIPDAGDAAGDSHARQSGAGPEGVIPDAGDAAGDRQARQPGAGIEGEIPDAGDAGGNRHAGQAVIASERIVSYAAYRQAVDGGRNDQATPGTRVSGERGGVANRGVAVVAKSPLGHENAVIASGVAIGVSDGKAVVIGRPDLQAAEVCADLLCRGSVVWRERHDGGGAIGGGETVVEARGGG